MRDLVMRVALATLIFISCASPALAQTKPDDKSKSPESTGRSVNEDEKGKMQPQGQTGPLETRSGGAPAASPQGETPPGMQSAPDGSSKSVVEPKK
jgi:hypothetical protein